MRVKLKLRAKYYGGSLPMNCNHAITGLVYRILGQASTEFATRLHDTGFKDEGRNFKLFTFSRLQFSRCHLSNNRIVLDDPMVDLHISSPVNEFIEHFVAGMFKCKEFQLVNLPFSLAEAETLTQPNRSTFMRLRALSPITETVREDGAKHPRFLGPEDEWSEVIQRNLLRKYRALHGCEPIDKNLRWMWDQEYFNRMNSQGRRASTLIEINGIRVRGWLAPFSVEGSPELIELGYEAGFGSRNSVGFGMAECKMQN